MPNYELNAELNIPNYQLNTELNELPPYQANLIVDFHPRINEVTATVDDGVGTPNVNVTNSGTPYERSFNLAFHNLKGEQGIQGEQGIPGENGKVVWRTW